MQACPITCDEAADGTKICESKCSEAMPAEKSIIEAGKVYNSRMNTFVYSFTIGFTFFLVGYAILIAYRNCQENKDQVSCKQ